MRYQSTRPKRQFLAGVSCPKCHAMDAVVQVQLFEPVADEYIECTQCGHQERRPKPSELDSNAQQVQLGQLSGTADTQADEESAVQLVNFKGVNKASQDASDK